MFSLLDFRIDEIDSRHWIKFRNSGKLNLVSVSVLIYRQIDIIITVLDCTNRYCNDLGWSVVRCEKPIEHRYILFSFHVRYYCYNNEIKLNSNQVCLNLSFLSSSLVIFLQLTEIISAINAEVWISWNWRVVWRMEFNFRNQQTNFSH